MQTFDGLSIPNNNSNPTPYNILDIASLQLKDTGTYKCTVNNGIMDTEGNLDQMTTQEINVKGNSLNKCLTQVVYAIK